MEFRNREESERYHVFNWFFQPQIFSAAGEGDGGVRIFRSGNYDINPGDGGGGSRVCVLFPGIARGKINSAVTSRVSDVTARRGPMTSRIPPSPEINDKHCE